MGTVYQAVHREMQRDVALKVMRSDLTDQESLKKRFRREVLAAAKKHLPAVLQNESHPYLQERDLRDFCRINGIVFQVLG